MVASAIITIMQWKSLRRKIRPRYRRIRILDRLPNVSDRFAFIGRGYLIKYASPKIELFLIIFHPRHGCIKISVPKHYQ